MKTISPEYLDKARALIQSGYNNAANSFKTLVNQNVSISNEKIEFVDDPQVVKKAILKEDNQTILITELIGQLDGESYLVFNPQEKEQICDMCRAMFGNNNAIDDDTILKEVDNIISAAVVTEFSNQLNIRIFGDVPKLSTDMDDIIEGLIGEGNKYIILTDAHFIFENNVEVTPQFIWKLDEAFLELFREPKTA